MGEASFALLNISLSRARATIIIFTNEKRHYGGKVERMLQLILLPYNLTKNTEIKAVWPSG